MQKFPIVCVDNFFDDANNIVNFAHSLPFDNENNGTGQYPGIRTKPLHEINQEYFNKFCLKFLSLFYDLSDRNNNLQWNIYTAFHKMPKYSPDECDVVNTGWIHTDNSLMAGVVYLNPHAPLESGTSIYRFKDDYSFERNIDDLNHYAEDMIKLYQHGDDTNFRESLNKTNAMFEETLRISNVYNRLVAYDSSVWHKPTNYIMEEDRLTQVFFINSLTCNGFPVQRMRNIKL